MLKASDCKECIPKWDNYITLPRLGEHYGKGVQKKKKDVSIGGWERMLQKVLFWTKHTCCANELPGAVATCPKY